MPMQNPWAVPRCFLEEGEVQTVETLIKCIVIASGNDASVAMAEYISGTEEAFVDAMNKRAEGLGMMNTHFYRLLRADRGSGSSDYGRDIAIMSRGADQLLPGNT